MSDNKNDNLKIATRIIGEVLELFLRHPDFELSWVEEKGYERWAANYRQLLSAFEYTTHRIGSVEKGLQTQLGDLEKEYTGMEEKLNRGRAEMGELRSRKDLGTISLYDMEREQKLLESYLHFRERFCNVYDTGVHQHSRHMQENRSIMEYYVSGCRALEETRKKIEALIAEEDRLLRELIETEEKKLKEFR